MDVCLTSLLQGHLLVFALENVLVIEKGLLYVELHLVVRIDKICSYLIKDESTKSMAIVEEG